MYNTAIILNIKQVGIFKNKVILGLLCSISAFFMPIYVAIPLSLILILLILIKIICEQRSINNIKEYINDDTIKGYHLIFKLVNNNDISFSTTIEEFNKIKEWYENSNEMSYSIKNICSSPITIYCGKYVNLNKVNIVEFSYSSITNKKNILNPIIYILTYPAPRIFDVFSYVKNLFLAPIILVSYIIYETNILNSDIKSILSNTSMLNNILNTAISFITIIFVFYYIVFFILKVLGMSSQDKDYIYELKNQTRSKVYNYASFNFVIIGCLSYALLSVNIL